jgi:hypothetical protein
LERRWRKEIGREHSARLLSRSDATLSVGEKERYRATLIARGVLLPSADEEIADPARSHELYRGAVAWLLEQTRPTAEKTMLLDENIAYGFRRNLLGLKPIGLALILVALGINAYLTYRADWGSDASITGTIAGLGLAGLALAWTFLVTKQFVIDASHAYAVRLLAQCEHLTAPSPKAPRTRKKPPRMQGIGRHQASDHPMLGPDLARPIVQLTPPSRMMPDTGLPICRSSAGRHGTRVKS